MKTFSADLAKFAAKIDRTLEQTYRGVTIKLFSRVILDTPVLDGILRGSWYSQENTPRIDSTPRVDRVGSLAINEMKQIANRSQLGNIMTMANSMPYAYRIEYEGWSKEKSPEGMVRKNFAAIQGIISEAVQEAKQ